MKTKLLAVLALTVSFIFISAISATAWVYSLDSSDVAMTCIDVTIHVIGETDRPDHPVLYRMVFVPDSGDPFQQSGSFIVNGSFDVTKTIDLAAALCGNYTVYTHIYFPCGIHKLFPAYLDCPCGDGCTRTPGYWKNYPDTWPDDEIYIGGVSYTKDEAITIMSTPEAGDKTYTLFRALVAAKLNVLLGSDDSCIAESITAADDWMAQYGPVGSGVAASDAAWREGEPLSFALDDYNNGYLCAPHCD